MVVGEEGKDEEEGEKEEEEEGRDDGVGDPEKLFECLNRERVQDTRPPHIPPAPPGRWKLFTFLRGEAGHADASLL